MSQELVRDLLSIADRYTLAWTRPMHSTIIEGLGQGRPLAGLLRESLAPGGLPYEEAAQKFVDRMLVSTDTLVDRGLVPRAVAVGKSFAQKSLAHLIQVEEPLLRTMMQQWQLGVITIQDVGAALDRTLAQARAITDTALGAIQRVAARDLSRSIADSPDIYFVYQGPDDSRTRPYCAALVGRAVVEHKLARTPNGAGLPPLVYCGGWNCRHSLLPTNLRMIAASDIPIATDADYALAVAGGSR